MLECTTCLNYMKYYAMAAYVVGVNLLDTHMYMGDAQTHRPTLGLEPAWAWSGTLVSHENYMISLIYLRDLVWHTRGV